MTTLNKAETKAAWAAVAVVVEHLVLADKSRLLKKKYTDPGLMPGFFVLETIKK